MQRPWKRLAHGAGWKKRPLEDRQARQLLFPVLQLGVNPLALELLTLPARVMAVLNRQRGKRRRAVRAAGHVQRHRFPCEHTVRPAVGDDVMQHEREDMFVLAHAEQTDAPQRPHAQIEWTSYFL